MRLREHRRTAATGLAATLLALPALASSATPAAADGSTPLPAASYGDIVVDGSHHQVFISDPSGGKLVVTDYEGQVIAEIPGLAGASGLALSNDSGTLYTALRDASAIAAIDTGSLAETGRYATGDSSEPEDLALAGGMLWFAWDAGDGWSGAIGSVDLSGGSPVVSPNPGRKWSVAPALEADPSAPDTLLAGDPGVSATTMIRYDVGDGTLREQAVQHDGGPEGWGFMSDMALTEDGQSVITATGAPYSHQVFSTSDLSYEGSYASNPYPNSVAVSPKGVVAAGINGTYAADIYIHRPGTNTLLRTYEITKPGDFDHPSKNLLDAGLAWSPDGERLFAVIGESRGENPELRVLAGAAKAESALTLAAPATGVTGERLTVTGTLTSSDPFPRDTTVKVYREDPQDWGGKTYLGEYTVGRNGGLRFSDTPEHEGRNTYTVVFDGDDGHTGTTATADVMVTNAP